MKNAIPIHSLLITIAIVILALTPCLHAQEKETYIIGGGDVLDITTWKEPDFSREEILVKIDGNISFPLVGEIQAEGKTTLQLQNTIEKMLTEYVASPTVTVTVRSTGSKMFYILGEVVNTGEYPLTKHLTVLQAFALAGGFTEWASKKEIILLRNVDGNEQALTINYKNILKGKDYSQNVKIQANDTIIVP